VVDGLGLKQSEESYERARENRRWAIETARQQGSTLPADIWGIGEELSPTKAPEAS
jgi:hypothetical protein